MTEPTKTDISSNIKEPSGFDTTYSKVGVSSKITNVVDSFDRIINSKGKNYLYEQMEKNEPLINAFANLLESIATSEELPLKIAKVSDEEKEQAEWHRNFVQQVIDDMEIPFSDSLKDFLRTPKYGFAIAEMVAKKRLGKNKNNPKKHSKYNDGYIGLRKFAPRHQKTVEDWEYDDYGRLSAVVQSNPNQYGDKTKIPYDRILHFKIRSYNGNPYGESLYRSAALAYYEKKEILKEQSIRFYRGFEGIPRFFYPSAWADKSSAMYPYLQEFETTVKNIRLGQDCGLVMPKIIDPSTGKDMIGFEIVTGDSPVNQDVEKMVDRRDDYIAISLLSDLFLTGKTASVSGSLAQLKVDIFSGFVIMLLNIIVNELNNKFIPFLWDLNGFDEKYMPAFATTGISKLNMTNIQLFLQSSGKTGLISPSLKLENELRKMVFGGAVSPATEEEYNQAKEDRKANNNNKNNNTIDDTNSLNKL